MKELTYEEWQKNPTPRMMWVWDYDDETDKVQRKVVYMIKRKNITRYPVRTTTDDDTNYELYKHCAEIEKPKTRRMTNKELSRWIRENPTREYKYKKVTDYIYSFYEYKECYADKEVDDILLIREDDGEWREPLTDDFMNKEMKN